MRKRIKPKNSLKIWLAHSSNYPVVFLESEIKIIAYAEITKGI